MSLKFIKLRRKMISGDRIAKAIENALTGAAYDAKADFEVTTQTFDHKPEFVIESSPGHRKVFTDDEIYGMLDRGTRPHPIDPVHAPFLAFSGGHQAKTTPRVIASRPGGSSGPTVYTTHVNHPGTEPREFAKTIKEKWDRELPDIMQRAIDSEMNG